MGYRRPRSSRALGAGPLGAGVLAVALPLADEVGDVTDDFFAVAEHGQVDVGDRFGVVGAMTTDCDEWIGIGTPSRVDRHAGKIDAVDEVRVGQLGREIEGDDVELASRFVGVDREQGRPSRRRALPCRPGA